MKRRGDTVRYTVEEIDDILARGESRTDWEAVRGMTEQELEAIRAALADEIEKAIEQAESEPDPRPEDAATHVYAADNPLPDGTRA